METRTNAELVEEINLGVKDTLADMGEDAPHEDEIVLEIARSVCYCLEPKRRQEVFEAVGLYGFTHDTLRVTDVMDAMAPPQPEDALSFDEVEAAGLDGTLRNM